MNFGFVTVQEKYRSLLWLEKPDAEELTDEQAIAFSIEKWETIAEEHRRLLETRENFIVCSGACKTCALCMKYAPSCGGCPIQRVTGMSSCWGTPHHDYELHPSVETAELEAQFLRELLENPESWKDEEWLNERGLSST